jgi:hypothetical protein
MVDITGPLSDFTTFINGAHLDSTTNLAASVFSPYLTIAQSSGPTPTLQAANTFYYDADVASTASASGVAGNIPFIPFDPADYTLGGRTLKLRLEVISYVSGTVGTRTFTWGLYPLSSVAGGANQLAPTLGSVTAGSTVVRANPVDATIYRDVGSDFTPPVAGTYIIGFTTTGSQPSTSQIQSDVRLQARWV